jgi:hypothetical protein
MWVKKRRVGEEVAVRVTDVQRGRVEMIVKTWQGKMTKL